MGVFPSRLHKSAVPCVHLTLASSECFSSFLRSSALDGSCHNSSKNGFCEKGKEKASSIESGMRRAGDGACRRYRLIHIMSVNMYDHSLLGNVENCLEL